MADISEITLEWNGDVNAIATKATGATDHSCILFLANEAKRLMDPYVPANNLVLAQNVRVYEEKGVGIVHYNSPYAHYQWEGIVYVDPYTGKGAFTDGLRFWSRPGVAKRPSGRSLEHSHFRHPLATSHWEQAMMVARKDDLTRAYESYLKRRG